MADPLADIESKLKPERASSYFSSERWNDLVWLVGEVKRLREELALSEAENDQWQLKVAENWREIEQLRASKLTQ